LPARARREDVERQQAEFESRWGVAEEVGAPVAQEAGAPVAAEVGASAAAASNGQGEPDLEPVLAVGWRAVAAENPLPAIVWRASGNDGPSGNGNSG
jgi:hypothetical protein